MTKHQNVIVHIASSADGYLARPDDDLEWLRSRPKPEGFYGTSAFMSRSTRGCVASNCITALRSLDRRIL